jgi:hypothetical protein
VSATSESFEETIRALTRPINGQYPRPWMTRASDPRACKVFIVGKNQRNGYCQEALTHDRHLDALFNRNGETCRGIYDELTQGKPSPTRKNTDRLVDRLARLGVRDVLETNVICYSSPMSADLRLDSNAGGAARGGELFLYLIDAIDPRVMIVHGAGAEKQLSKILRAPLGGEPTTADVVRYVNVGSRAIVTIPSLAPPAYNKWCSWADAHFDAVAQFVAAY